MRRENPYFARNAVNQLWAHFFGSELVESLDDPSGENASSHPALLGQLAQAFVESGLDLTHLTTAIVLTKAYQLSSVTTGPIVAPRLFVRPMVRGLTGDRCTTASALPLACRRCGTTSTR